MSQGPSSESSAEERAAIAPHAGAPAGVSPGASPGASAGANASVGGGFRSRSDLRRRLGYYLIGVAIGCVMAGLMLSARARMAKPVQQPGQQASPQTVTGDRGQTTPSKQQSDASYE